MWAGPDDIAEAVERLRAGGLVAFPTETVYGLGADALNPEAVLRVFAAKGRPSHNPLIVHVSGAEMARTVAAEWPDEAERLATAFWPGPLTLVLPKQPCVPAEVTAGGPTVAVRCPNHPIALKLLDRFGGPLVGPSANISGRVSPTTAAHVREAFSPNMVLVLDGGPCAGGIESTVLKLGNPLRILRAGLVTPEQIAAVVGRQVVLEGTAEGPLESPGQLESHYAPITRVILTSADQVASLVRGVVSAVVLSHIPVDAPPAARLFTLSSEPRAYASQLYSTLRTADAVGAATIIVVRPEPSGSTEERAIWQAILDRLTRAAAPVDNEKRRG